MITPEERTEVFECCIRRSCACRRNDTAVRERLCPGSPAVGRELAQRHALYLRSGAVLRIGADAPPEGGGASESSKALCARDVRCRMAMVP